MLGPDIIYRLNEDLTVLDMDQILKNQEKARKYDTLEENDCYGAHEIVERLKKRIEECPDYSNLGLELELQKILGEAK